jgi:hypothetical protein
MDEIPEMNEMDTSFGSMASGGGVLHHFTQQEGEQHEPLHRAYTTNVMLSAVNEDEEESQSQSQSQSQTQLQDLEVDEFGGCDGILHWDDGNEDASFLLEFNPDADNDDATSAVREVFGVTPKERGGNNDGNEDDNEGGEKRTRRRASLNADFFIKEVNAGSRSRVGDAKAKTRPAPRKATGKKASVPLEAFGHSATATATATAFTSTATTSIASTPAEGMRCSLLTISYESSAAIAQQFRSDFVAIA